MAIQELDNSIASDMPTHQHREGGQDVRNPGSVGGTWPPEMNASHNRIKGIYPEVVNADGLDQFRHTYNEYNQFILGNYQTRLQIRAVLSREALHAIAQDLVFSSHVEAVVNLDGGVWGENPVSVYFGSNSPERKASPADQSYVQQNIHQALTVNRQEYPELLRQSTDNGYNIEILDVFHDTELVIDQLAVLYGRFGWNREEVAKLVNNPNNIFACAKKYNADTQQDEIVSAGIAEMAAVPLNGKTFRMVEITEAATDKEHEKKGCYLALSSLLLREVAMRSKRNILGGEVDVVFGENNGLSPAVMRISKKQGRTLSVESPGEFPNSGILSQQVPIETPGINRDAPYNDLVVAYLTRNRLYDYYLPPDFV